VQVANDKPCLHSKHIQRNLTNCCFVSIVLFYIVIIMSLVRYVKLRVPAGSAKPGPAIGQSLGPLGINMAEFCKQFNERSVQTYKKDTPLQVRLSAMSDRTFTFAIRTPPTPYLILQVVGLSKGTSNPDPMKPVAYISPEAVYEIAKIKQLDDMRSHLPLEGIAKSVVGTARTMGIICRDVDDDGQQRTDVDVDTNEDVAA
jgi:large subunit ribosomal protein L11